MKATILWEGEKDFGNNAADKSWYNRCVAVGGVRWPLPSYYYLEREGFALSSL